MKQILLIIAAVSLLAATPKSCNTNVKGGNEGQDVKDTVAVDPSAPTPSAAELIVTVYSNAYDGFLNVREKPDVTSKIIGKILNGPIGAIKMGEVGGWTIVKVGDTVGYASSRYLQTSPTPVFTDKDMEKCLRGIWTTKTPMNQKQVVLFENNLFAEGYSIEGLVIFGEWSVQGSILLLQRRKVQNPGEYEWNDDNTLEKWVVVNGDSIKDDINEPLTRLRVLSDEAFEKLDSPKWYEMDEATRISLYEAAHLRVRGTYPSGN